MTLRGSAPSGPRLVGVVCMAALSSATFVGCGDGADPTAGTCEEKEAPRYPALEAVADDTLSTVAHTVARISRCEDAGTPHASVLAGVTP